MVQANAILTTLFVSLLVFTCAIALHSNPAVAGTYHAAESQQTWQRVNHGSLRGPRKHIVNPTVKHPFQVPKMPV
ncbi:conserved hypothetical protein [Ricinus communis]|uniref:Transmembrane protein n=1 Tax=Ricinus communis TaxID=3988 RepID=B9RZ28_RICCO|nr:conserved hypothetical protein [Ricinus communis]